MMLAGLGGPAAIILGGGLALSSTAVAMQVLSDRGESGSRHGRATFAVLLLQVSLSLSTQSVLCFAAWAILHPQCLQLSYRNVYFKSCTQASHVSAQSASYNFVLSAFLQAQSKTRAVIKLMSVDHTAQYVEEFCHYSSIISAQSLMLCNASSCLMHEACQKVFMQSASCLHSKSMHTAQPRQMCTLSQDLVVTMLHPASSFCSTLHHFSAIARAIEAAAVKAPTAMYVSGCASPTDSLCLRRILQW